MFELENTNEYDIELVVLGDPKAQKRHRDQGRVIKLKGQNGKTRFIKPKYDPMAGDKADFLSMVQRYAPAKPFDCPIRVDIDCYFKRPKSHYRTGRYANILKPSVPIWHTVKPDRDNLEKFIEDALKGVYWRDDCIICDGRFTKRYDDKPRIEIHIKVLGD